MREMILPEDGPKRRLFDAASRLFAEQGFVRVSVRDIAAAIGANIAAVNYHFGSRDDLLALVVGRHLAPVTEERLARLDGVERKGSGKAAPVEEIIDAYLRPLLTQSRKVVLPEGAYCELMARIFSAGEQELGGVVAGQSRQVIERFNRAIAKALPMLLGDEVQWRMQFVNGALVRLLAQPNGSLEAALARLSRFAAAGLREGVEGDVVAKAGPQAMFDF